MAMMTNEEIETATLDQLNEELAAGGFPSEETRLDNARNAVRNMIAELNRPVVEVCSCTEWVRDRDLDQEGIDESDLSDAASYYASEVFDGLREKGFDVSWPGGNRSLYHQWNGAHFVTKLGCVGSWKKLTEAQIEVIEEVRKAAQAEVNARWVREKFDFAFATDSESGTIKAESFEEACEQLEAMFTEEALADGAWGWVEDQDGDRFLIGEKPE